MRFPEEFQGHSYTVKEDLGSLGGVLGILMVISGRVLRVFEKVLMGLREVLGCSEAFQGALGFKEIFSVSRRFSGIFWEIKKGFTGFSGMVCSISWSFTKFQGDSRAFQELLWKFIVFREC